MTVKPPVPDDGETVATAGALDAAANDPPYPVSETVTLCVCPIDVSAIVEGDATGGLPGGEIPETVTPNDDDPP